MFQLQKSLGAVLIGLVLASLSAAEEPAMPDLEALLLEDLADKPKLSAEAKPAKPDTGFDRELIQDLTEGEDIGAEKENPLKELAERMKQSQQRIRGRDTSEETQTLQRDISDRLAQLIEQAQKQSKSGGGESKSGSGKAGNQSGADGGNPTPGPASESTQRVDRSETVERGSADVHDVIRRVWGHLPDKMREQMQNSLDDQFLPKYEKLIEDYYQRLAEERGPGT